MVEDTLQNDIVAAGSASVPDKPLVVYGAMWCPDVRRMRVHLDRLGVAYEYRDIDRDPGAMDELLALRGKAWLVPTLVLPDGTVLDNPARDGLGERLGCKPADAPDEA